MHIIDARYAPLVKISFFKQTPEMRRETIRQTDDMLEHGIIKENKFKWHFLVVLEEKN